MLAAVAAAAVLAVPRVVMEPGVKEAQMEQRFWAVSDPSDPAYGEHLSREELRNMVAAPQSAVAAVQDWIRASGSASEVAQTGDSIRAVLPCSTLESMLGTQFFAFRHNVHDVRVVRAVAQYSLPAEIAEHVALVADVLALPRISHPKAVHADATAPSFPTGDNCGGKCGASFVTPAVLTQAYKLGAAPTGATKGSIAVAEFQGQQWDTKDLSTWGGACAINATVDKQVGKNSGTRCKVPIVGTELCGECLLDIEYAKAVAGDIQLSDIYSKSFSLLDWMTSVLDMGSDLPLIHSVSYGNDEVQQTGAEYMRSCNQQFMKAGLRGVSVLFASGDQGVLGRSGTGTRYHPDFPAGSPYITAVGGTDFAQRSIIGAEKTWSLGGGGFSDTFATPSYQSAAVKTYLAAKDLPPAAKWNSTGRGYPDVSALAGTANPYCVHAGGMFAGVGGTSAACPVVAGVFAKLNAVRLAKGGKALGFLNPFIYQLAGKGFNDVTLGRNCGKTTCTTEGFPAVAGWDAATGWGTPDFATLKTLV